MFERLEQERREKEEERLRQVKFNEMKASPGNIIKHYINIIYI